MRSLTETAYYTRRAINWTILAMILYVIIRIFWGVIVGIFLYFFPPQPPPATHAFGKLPKIIFQEATPSANLNLTLETISGGVPETPRTAIVFHVPRQAANLLAMTRTQEFVESFKLDPKPIQIQKNIYRFNDPYLILRTLTYNIVTNNFVLAYDFTRDTGVFNEKKLPESDENAFIVADDLLKSHKIFPDDIKEGQRKISYLKLVGDKLLTTTSLSKANAIRVNYFKKDIKGIPVYTPKLSINVLMLAIFGTSYYKNFFDEEIVPAKIYTPNPDESLISVTMSGSENFRKRFLEFKYIYWPVDHETNATYSLKTGDEAWADLQSGKGFIARFPSGGNTAIVREASIGYYESENTQDYIQPIFIFEGDNGFLGYVQAVNSQWVE